MTDLRAGKLQRLEEETYFHFYFFSYRVRTSVKVFFYYVYLCVRIGSPNWSVNTVVIRAARSMGRSELLEVWSFRCFVCTSPRLYFSVRFSACSASCAASSFFPGVVDFIPSSPLTVAE